MRTRSCFLAIVTAAVLLPLTVWAHSGNGPCVDCHIMHNSEDGAAVNAAGPQPQLLRFACVGCHAYTQNDPGTGRADDTLGLAAPQVGPQVAGGGSQLSGGYFNTTGGAADSTTHNVADLFGAATGADSVLNGNSAPGGSMLIENGVTGEPVLTCEHCHDLSIGHAAADLPRTGIATSSYRMLNGNGAGVYVSGTGDINFEDGAGQNLYDATSMNLFCASCHGGFHAAFQGAASPWIRHPTDITTNGYATNYDGSDKIVPLGGAGAANLVMCISCHRPHGNANLDMLRFNYNNGTDNEAGGATVSVGCESCHGAK